MPASLFGFYKWLYSKTISFEAERSDAMIVDMINEMTTRLVICGISPMFCEYSRQNEDSSWISKMVRPHTTQGN